MLKTIPFLVLALLVSGCADPRQDPSHLEPGNSIQVAQDALASGGRGGRYDDGSTIGAVQSQTYPGPPNVPELTSAQIDYIWFTQTESLDGESQRDPVWVKVKVAETSFTASHRHREKSLLNDAETGIPRRNQIPRSQRLRPSSQALSHDDDDQGMPLVRQGQSTTRVTVAGFDAAGTPTVLGTQTIPTPPNGDISTRDGVNNVLQQYNANLQQFNTNNPTGSGDSASSGIERPLTPGANPGAGTTPIPTTGR